MKPVRDPKKAPAPDYSLMRYAGLGTELAAGIAGFTLLGYWIDHKFGTRPVWLVVGASIGCVGGMYHLIRRAMKMARQQGITRTPRRTRPSDDSDEQTTD